MWITLSDIERGCAEAANGAGYPSGLAGEAGSAARWLAARGLPFLRPLTAGVLSQMHRLEAFDSAPRVGCCYGAVETSQCLGPISVATAIANERLQLPAGADEVSFRSLAAPVLLLPVVGRLAKQQGRALLVRWPGAAIECRAGEIITGDVSRVVLETAAAEWVTVAETRAAGPERLTPTVHHIGANVDERQWRELCAFAHRTFIPERATARWGGAGTGRRDQD